MADNQTATTPEDTAIAITLAAHDPDGKPLTYSIVTQPSHGSVNLLGPTAVYTPNAAYSGQDSFTFKANNGALDSTIATVSLAITRINHPPVARFDSRRILHVEHRVANAPQCHAVVTRGQEAAAPHAGEQGLSVARLRERRREHHERGQVVGLAPQAVLTDKMTIARTMAVRTVRKLNRFASVNAPRVPRRQFALCSLFLFSFMSLSPMFFSGGCPDRSTRSANL